MYGETGIVIGIYKNSLEVLWDDVRIGSSDIHGRCGAFRGSIVDLSDVFHIDGWVKYLEKRKDGEGEWDGLTDIDIFIKQFMHNQIDDIVDIDGDLEEGTVGEKENEEVKKYEKKFKRKDAREGKETVRVRSLAVVGAQAGKEGPVEEAKVDDNI